MNSPSEKQVIQPDFNYEILKTADGSPTVRLWKTAQEPECMHHLGGALTESLYIYDQALTASQKFSESFHVLSVGLGLGYNELITIGRALVSNQDMDKLYIESFEIESFLRSSFLNWLNETADVGAWTEMYDSILNSVAEHFQTLPGLIKNALLEMLTQKRWILREELNASTEFNQHFHCILFDAFSKGATPALWDEEFLKEFLQKVSAEKCILSTYAATGSLKRALKAKNYLVELRPGFAGKRQSTWAIRA